MSAVSNTAPRVVQPGLLTTDPPALLGGRCTSCGALRFPHRNICPRCQSTQVDAVPLSKHGTVYTFTIVRSKPPGYLGEVPYAFGLVELPEGLRVIATLNAANLDSIAVGDAVEFELMMLGTGDEAVLSYAFRHGGTQ